MPISYVEWKGLETQIIAKHGIEHSRYTDFDPLEMDQYSSLNQLSKSLAESASDLVDFKNTLSDKIRDTESLLLQQSRIQAEIQEGLMRTRLVPFSRLFAFTTNCSSDVYSIE